MHLDETALLNLLLLADADHVAVDDRSRAAAAYRQTCRLIDREQGFAILLTRCTGRLAAFGGAHGQRPLARWYSLSITFCEPDFGPTVCVDFRFADQVVRTLFRDAADFAVATTDTFVPGTVQINLACNERWQPVAWRSRMPTPSWRRWVDRAELIELEVDA